MVTFLDHLRTGWILIALDVVVSFRGVATSNTSRERRETAAGQNRNEPPGMGRARSGSLVADSR